MLIFGAVSLASRMNCLGSKVRTTISPDFCTARNAAAVLESYRFWTVSIWRKTSSDIPVGWKYFELSHAGYLYNSLVTYRENNDLPFCTHLWDEMGGGGGQNCSSYFDSHDDELQQPSLSYREIANFVKARIADFPEIKIAKFVKTKIAYFPCKMQLKIRKICV